MRKEASGKESRKNVFDRKKNMEYHLKNMWAQVDSMKEGREKNICASIARFCEDEYDKEFGGHG